jgi:hypothetical protein
MELPISDPKPTSATRSQRFRFFDLFEPQQPSKEIPCFLLAALRRCELDVVDSSQGHGFTIR